MGLDQLIESDDESKYEKSEFLNGLVVGLIIGEGSFHIGVSRQEGRTVPFYAYAEFKMNLGEYDEDAVRFLEDYLGVGNVNRISRSKDTEKDLFRYKCSNIGEIQEVIVPFFDKAFEKVPVRTDKYESYKIWRKVATTKKDGRSASTEYLAAHTLMAAYAKPKVNQTSKGRSHVTYEETKQEIAKEFPDVVKSRESEVKEEIDEVVR